MGSILFVNANLINHNGNIDYNKNILIQEGLIKYVGDELLQADSIYDCTDKYISPTFTNLHTHSPMNIFKGIAEDVSIDEWFNKIIWPYEAKLTKEDIYHASRIAIAEMLGYGVSAYADHYFFPKEIIQAAKNLGIKIDMAPTLFSIGGNFNKELEDSVNLVHKYKDDDNVVITLGPHSPYTCNFKDLQTIANYAKELNLKIHIHVSETLEQVQDSLKDKGMTPIEELHRAGCLNGKIILAHGLYILEEDLKYINENTSFVLSPKTYLKLNMGLGNIFNFVERVSISIGSDGAASSNSLNPLEQARLLGLLGKYITKDATKFTLKDIWKFLMEGHNILEFNSGKVQEGYSADLIIWDLNSPNTSVNNNPLASIIYSSHSSNIESILISGKYVKNHGKTSIDVTKSIDHCNEKIKTLIKEGGGKTDLKF